MIIISIFSIIFGYILGSILPAYILGRLKGIDIRKIGTKNAGTSNVYHELGLKYALITGTYDFFKGLLAIWISSLFGANFAITQLAGYAAVIGHVFPFYIKFKGGQGLATSMALLIYYVINYIFYDTIILVFLLYILLILILFRVACKVSNLLAMLIYPLLGYSLWVFYPGNKFNIFASIILSYIVIMAFYNIIKFKTIKVKEELKHNWWKLVFYPFLMIFVVLYAYLPIISLILIGVLTIIMGSISLMKYLNQNREGKTLGRIKQFFQEIKIKKLLLISITLMGMFLAMIIFSFINKNIVIAALTYSLFGITFSMFFNISFGRRKLFHKTLEGFLGFIIIVLILAFVLFSILDLTPLILLVGGLGTAVFWTIPLRINQHLTLPIVSSILMTIMLFIGL
ncbi:MAG: glycerol-3-phosphate acyltransferase [Candidatus Thorarchaeota archaeon]